jgi:aspartate racemase
MAFVHCFHRAMPYTHDHGAPGVCKIAGMRIPGIVGGIGPESTIDYYRKILAGVREQRPFDPEPQLIIHSISAQTLLGLAGRGDREALAEYLLPPLTALARGGADFAAFASNTPHLVFDLVSHRSPLPLVSIVETARAAAVTRGLRRLGLFGTGFTMRAPMYPDAFAAAALEVITPTAEEQAVIHNRYVNELVRGQFLPATRDELTEVVRRMVRRDGIDALILGGTELSLLFANADDLPVPLLDAAAIHAAAIVQQMLH